MKGKLTKLPSLILKPKHSTVKAVKANLEEKGVDQPTKDMKLELITILIRGEKTRKKETTEEMILKEDIEENEAVPDTVTEVTIPVKGEA